MMFRLRNNAAFYTRLQRRPSSSTTRIILGEDLAATAYKPELVEKDKYDQWEKDDVFRADNWSCKPVFSMVLPPPNVTGKLHLGHALTCTVQDVIVRRKRALGLNVLWLPGTDHAGIATQGIVEKYLKNTQNADRHSLGRDKFNQQVWDWVHKHGNTITNQLRTLGCSLDWSRETFTMDTNHTCAVNTAFIKLFEKGLIYRKKALVNWCNRLKSTVSDIEVENISIKSPIEMHLQGYEKPIKFGFLYNFAYKVVGANEEVVVATTMPETMLGDMAVAVHPNDERYNNLINKSVIHPLTQKTMPIISDEFVDMNFGTGAVKITPAHSKVDYEIAKTHNLPLLQVINEEGVMENCGNFNGMKRYDCRIKVLEELDKLGVLRGLRPHEMNLPICSRSGNVIDHLPKEQWFLSCSKLNAKALELIESGTLRIDPDKFVKNWVNWTVDDRDWCISRQLWWGHQIPAYKCVEGRDVIWVAATDDISAKTQAATYLRTSLDNILVERDSDVLDTWFSSGIYPFAALGWPNLDSKDYKDFYPLDLMATGHDILGFWVHRMVILGLELTEKIPFQNVLLHGIICDTKGAKMSKSKGNVIDPIDVINGISADRLRHKTIDMHNNGVLSKDELNKALVYHKHNFSKGIPECGVDALRFTLLSQDIKSHFVNFDLDMCHANKLFCNKIWQSINYMRMNYSKLKPLETKVSIEDLTYFDKWILSRLSNMVERVNQSMDANDFHLATKSLRTLIYNEFCDVYLEATKPGFGNDNIKGYAHAHTLSAVLNTSLRCLNPFMIYLTEDLIPKIPGFELNIIHNFNDNKIKWTFPQYEDFKLWKNVELETRVENLLDTMALVRELKALYGISNKYRPAFCVKTENNTLMTDIKDNEEVIVNLSKTSGVHYEANDNVKYGRGYLDESTEVAIEIITDDIESTLQSGKKRLETKIKKAEDSLRKLEHKDYDRDMISLRKQELEKLLRLKDNFKLLLSSN